MEEVIVIIDFGSQYTQLIARRVREQHVYCKIVPYNKVKCRNFTTNIKGIILSGSHLSVFQENAPDFNLQAVNSNIPILGVCYGAQLIAKQLGAKVKNNQIREYGHSQIDVILAKDPLLQNIPDKSVVWMSHSDSITDLPNTLLSLCTTNNNVLAAFKVSAKNIYGVQFHPEVSHSEIGKIIIHNFLFSICKCSACWKPESFIDSTIAQLKNTVSQKEKVLLGLSGGVDSTVTCFLLLKALGPERLKCVLIDNGLMRHQECIDLVKCYKSAGIDVDKLDRGDMFLNALKGIKDPEQKRKIIGNKFVEIFEQYTANHKDINWLAQGTIYPDIVESSGSTSLSETIKSHHNVGGLPEHMNLKLIEPLKNLFKDEVRKVGELLKIPEEILNRQPFPGPGIAIRIIGEVSKEKVSIVQRADAIFDKILKKEGLNTNIWQYGCILLPIKTVGVKGDKRIYGYTLALRAVDSIDGMTASYHHIPYDLLSLLATEIVNKIEEITRVVYDITSKPPATIEWE